jgi:hypothetical protein
MPCAAKEGSKASVLILVPPSTQNAKHSRSRHPTNEWEAQKTLIKKYYFDEDRSLEETTDMMKQGHGFQAG